ncbi:MAG: redoxin domain-containing protein [Deltaproteobacteria bacterium]|nr:redoxin domain-containing protein [Deltaproteobacteria bacterium]
MTKKKIAMCICILAFVSACASQGVNRQSMNTGSQAHDFTLSDQDGNMVSLSEVLQEYKGAIVAFYPKDDSRY